MKNFNLILTILVFSLHILIAASSDPVFGENGMVVSTSKQASEAGIKILKKGGAVGRRLDFMMQEFNRESNTLGSKSINTDITQSAVELKVLIEQMREQIANIE